MVYISPLIFIILIHTWYSYHRHHMLCDYLVETPQLHVEWQGILDGIKEIISKHFRYVYNMLVKWELSSISSKEFIIKCTGLSILYGYSILYCSHFHYDIIMYSSYLHVLEHIVNHLNIIQIPFKIMKFLQRTPIVFFNFGIIIWRLLLLLGGKGKERKLYLTTNDKMIKNYVMCTYMRIEDVMGRKYFGQKMSLLGFRFIQFVFSDEWG